MAKNGKTYSITEAQLEDMIKKASEAGTEAYKKEQSQSTRRKVDRMLYKTKVLLEKYTWLKAYAKNSVYTLEQAEKVNDGMADIEVLTKFGIFDNDKTLHNLKRGVITVNMLMTHVDNMLEVYRENCESSASKTKQRQYRVVYNMYLAEEKKTTRLEKPINYKHPWGAVIWVKVGLPVEVKNGKMYINGREIGERAEG